MVRGLGGRGEGGGGGVIGRYDSRTIVLDEPVCKC